MLVIDGNAIVHRAFHAFPSSLTTSTGLQDNAVYGFTTMLLQALKQFDPKYVLCTFDTHAKTFRHTQFVDYKAHRKPTDESLNAQFPLVKEVLDAFNIPYIEKDGFEADDILGTISNWIRFGRWKGNNLDMYILTGDRDMFQLVGDSIYACLPSGSFSNLIVYDREVVFEKYGYYPEQVTDYKGIVGDASDNIPGVKGIGEKTALSLLSKYGSLDEIYKNVNEIEGRYQKKLAEGVEQAYFSKELATIKQDVEVEVTLEECLLGDFDEQKLLDVFRKFEFRSLINKIPKSINGSTDDNQLDMFNTSSGQQVDDVTEVSDLKILKGSTLVTIASLETGYLLYASINSNKEINSVKISIENFSKSLGDVPANIELYVFGWEELVLQLGKDVSNKLLEIGFIDLQLLHFTISSGRKDYSIMTVLFDFLSFKSSPTDYTRIGKALIESVPVIKEKVGKLNFSDYVFGGWKKTSNSLSVEIKSIEDTVKYIEMPVSLALMDMEKRGIGVDKKALTDLKVELESNIDRLKTEIFTDIGHEFNLNSPKQLSDVIYNELGIADSLSGRRSRSTREEVLLQLKDSHPAIAKILKYREVNKVLGTYVIPYLDHISTQESSEIHTDFKQMGASSGRFASINPNMQNIPIRSEWGAKIRRVFVPREGYVFVAADYSQIEFRIMADISQDQALLKDFSQGKDIHRSTASRIFKVELEEVTSSQRSLAKTINFGILFGQTQFGLSSMLGIDRSQAQKYIDDYFEMYKGVEKYISESESFAATNGYVQSLLGRTRYISGLTSRNFNVRNAALREAVNMPIQGGEADIMKIAMIKIASYIEEKYIDSAYTLLQIHDEFIFEVKEEKAETFSKDVRDIMINVVQLSVPLDVNISKGYNMSELK